MSVDGWNAILVLGGIRSGKSGYAESLVADAASVRYVATAVGGADDPEWLARIETHQRRRPQSWSTEETGADPTRLTTLVAEAKPDETLLIDDLGGWVAALLDPSRQPSDDEATVTAFADAVRGCAARIVLVSPEVGLSLVPTTPVGRAFADALGATNQAVAAACDRVALVVAGQPTWLKPAAGTPHPTLPPAAGDPAGAPATSGAVSAGAVDADAVGAGAVGAGAVGDGAAGTDPSAGTGLAAADAAADGGRPDALSGPTMVLPVVTSGVEIHAGMDLPLPDESAGAQAQDRLSTLDVPGGGFGTLGPLVEFAAEAQGDAAPRPWDTVRVLVLHGTHGGAAAAGSDPADAARRIDDVKAGRGALARLADGAGVSLRIVEAPPAGAMESGPVLTPEQVKAALRQGWELAGTAADEGVDALVIAHVGTGAEAAAAAVVASTTGAEPVAVLERVLLPGNRLDDEAWMSRCAAVRDALHRTRHSPRGAEDVLADLGGGDIAVATGIILGAAARRLPVLLDGPVGAAAALVSRDLAAQARHWCLLPDDGGRPAVRQAADVLGLNPMLTVGLGLGEGANALAALPLLRAALDLSAILPGHPALDSDPAATPGA
jgi:nicotinate-nucleotide--dimethylbenzimidazole phosphoribosyltransferase